MVTIYLVRHGQTEENLAGVLQGHLPGRLTEKGKEQARGLIPQLAALSLDAVLCSDLQRCLDTLRIALDGRELPTEATPLLREIDWGSLTGKPIKDIDFSQLPADVETKEHLYARGGQVLDLLRKHYEGKTVLVLAHGMINRSIQANIEGISRDQIRTVSKMENAEIRKFVIE